MTARIAKLMALDNEINKLLSEIKIETETEELRYQKEIETLYVEMAESLRPFYEIYKKNPNMQQYSNKCIVINDDGWVLVLSDCGFYMGVNENQITLDLRKGWNSANVFAYHTFKNGDEKNPYLVKLVTNWKDWFPIYEQNFIDTYHKAKEQEIKYATKKLEKAKAKGA